MTIIESLEATCDLLNEKLPGSEGYGIVRANGMCRLVDGKGLAVSPWMDSPQLLADWLAPYYQGVCAARDALTRQPIRECSRCENAPRIPRCDCCDGKGRVYDNDSGIVRELTEAEHVAALAQDRADLERFT